MRTRPVPAYVALLFGAGALLACADSDPAPDEGDSTMTVFEEGVISSGRILENSTACEVDAVCYLRIEFADTSIVAVYGTGERPAPPCEIPADASDPAFRVEAGARVDVVVSRCGGEGLYLSEISLGDRD